jgi:hypothetical protein
MTARSGRTRLYTGHVTGDGQGFAGIIIALAVIPPFAVPEVPGLSIWCAVCARITPCNDKRLAAVAFRIDTPFAPIEEVLSCTAGRPFIGRNESADSGVSVEPFGVFVETASGVPLAELGFSVTPLGLRVGAARVFYAGLRVLVQPVSVGGAKWVCYAGLRRLVQPVNNSWKRWMAE